MQRKTHILIHDTLIRKNHISLITYEKYSLFIEFEMVHGGVHQFCFDSPEEWKQTLSRIEKDSGVLVD